MDNIYESNVHTAHMDLVEHDKEEDIETNW